MQAELEIEDAEGITQHMPLALDTYTIGRSASADIQLERSAVSRQHAKLEKTAQGSELTDMGSQSGTKVKGLPTQQHPLRHGDTIQISRFTLRFINAQAAHQDETRIDTRWSDEPAAPSISTINAVTPPKIGLGDIAALNAFGNALKEEDDTSARLASLCRLVAGEVIQGNWACVLELERDALQRPPAVLASAPAELIEQADIHLSRTTINAMLDRNAPVLASNALDASGVVEMSILADELQTAVAACPLGEFDGRVRLLYVQLPVQIATSEWLAVVSLASKEYEQAEAFRREQSLAQERAALDRDLENARKIQTSILPDGPNAPGLDIAWSFEPCDAVGGDLIDVLTLPDGRLLVTIADVSGHGLAASLATLSIHSVLRTAIKGGMDAEQMMTTLNEHLCDYLPANRFVTMLVVVIDPKTGQTQCISAGHHAPIVVAIDGTMRELAHGSQLVLGVESCAMSAEADQIETGETLLLYTDGLIEMQHPDGGMLQTKGLAELFAERRAQAGDAAALTQAMRRSLDVLQGDQPVLDDQSFLILHRT